MFKKRKSIGMLMISLMAGSLIISSGLITYFSITNSRKGVENQLAHNANDIIHILSQELDLLENIEKDFDDLFEKHLISSGTILGLDKEYSDYDLMKISKSTGISEMNIVNSEGVIEHSNLPGNIGYKYDDNSDIAKLLSKDGARAVEPIRQSEVDGFHYRYGTIGTINGAVQVGVSADDIVEMKNNMEISVITADIIDEENILFIASLDNDFNKVFNSRGEDIDIDISPDAREMAKIGRAHV